MNEPSVAKPWLVGTAAGVVAAAEKLKQESPEKLFVLLTRAAASADWDVFLPAFERTSGVKGLKLLLPAPDGLPMRYAYESALLPPDSWPIFIAVLETVAAVLQEAGDKVKPGQRLRAVVLDRVFALPAIRNLSVADQLVELLAA